MCTWWEFQPYIYSHLNRTGLIKLCLSLPITLVLTNGWNFDTQPLQPLVTSTYFKSPHLPLRAIISSHFALLQNTSPHLTSTYLTSSHLTSPHSPLLRFGSFIHVPSFGMFAKHILSYTLVVSRYTSKAFVGDRFSKLTMNFSRHLLCACQNRMYRIFCFSSLLVNITLQCQHMYK